MNEWLKGRQLSRSNNVLRLTGTGRTEKGGVADDDVVELGKWAWFFTKPLNGGIVIDGCDEALVGSSHVRKK